jgi:uncharacterized membrane protein YdjX (TVP38/TMEM64 family)
VNAALAGIRGTRGRVAVAGILVGLAGAGILFDMLSPAAAAATMHRAIELLRGVGAAGPPLFVVLQTVVAVSGVMPASLLGIAAGAIYGPAGGFALAACGSLLGSLVAFKLSRSLCRSTVERLIARHRRWRNLDAALAQRGWKIVCLMRLSPVMPFSATSYLLGLSSISLADYLTGSFAALPALFGYVLLGTLANAGLGGAAGGESPLRWLLLGAGAAATLLLMMHLGRIALQRQLDGD